MKKNKKKIITIIIIIILFILILFASLSIYNNYFKKDNSNINQIVNKIEKFNYELKEKDTHIFKETYSKLKNELNKDDIDYDNYAKLLGSLFIIDFYNLDNKVTNNDIGGIQFLCEECRETFTKKAHNTIYKYVKNNIDNDRIQELPIVESTEVLKTDIINYKYNNTDKSAYKIKYKINYEVDLDYQDEVELIIIHNEKKLEIVEVI